MKKHAGMRPQDVVVLLKIASKKNSTWLMKDIAHELFVSQSEVSESLNRSDLAGLMDVTQKTIFKESVLEFLFFGLRYVFPVQPGTVTRGIPTAHSAPPLKGMIHSEEVFVWPIAEGTARGQSIEPLYKTVPLAVLNDNELYQLLALVESLRVGKVRERDLAFAELKKRI
jgi:hypothetical protein